MQKIDCYITLNSPWSYFAYDRLAAIARRHNAVVDIKPADFTQVFGATGGLPLAKRAHERQAYRMMELRRWRDHLGIPIVLEPDFFPADERAGVRLVLAARRTGGDTLTLAREIGRALWERNEDMAQDQVLRDAAARAGLDFEQLRRVAGDEELDGEHAALTKEAVSRGVFGAPGIVLDSGEIFWGQDRLDFVDRALGA